MTLVTTKHERCPRCSGYIALDYNENICYMCGWRDSPPLKPLKLSVVHSSKDHLASHYDPFIPEQYNKIKRFYKRCPGSERLGDAISKTSLRCYVCYKTVKASASYRTALHLPNKYFQKQITEVLDRYKELKEREVSLIKKEKQHLSFQL